MYIYDIRIGRKCKVYGCCAINNDAMRTNNDLYVKRFSYSTYIATRVRSNSSRACSGNRAQAKASRHACMHAYMNLHTADWLHSTEGVQHAKPEHTHVKRSLQINLLTYNLSSYTCACILSHSATEGWNSERLKPTHAGLYALCLCQRTFQIEGSNYCILHCHTLHAASWHTVPYNVNPVLFSLPLFLSLTHIPLLFVFYR